MMTQGCDYSSKEVKSDNSYHSVELHLMDIAGQNIFKQITFDLLWKANHEHSKHQKQKVRNEDYHYFT
jgi:hypothetical protein